VYAKIICLQAKYFAMAKQENDGRFCIFTAAKIFPNYIFFPVAKELLIFHFCVRQSYAFLE
jgi:hypothetical protein